MRKMLIWCGATSLLVALPAAGQGQVVQLAPTPISMKERCAGKREDRSARGDAELLAAVEQLKQLLAEQKREIEEQRALLREQQEKLAALQNQFAQQAAAPATKAPANPSEPARAEDVRLLEGQLEAVADSTKELNERVAKVQTDLGNRTKAAEDRIKSIGPFSFSGDLRVRYEPFFSGGAKTSAAPQDRHRERFRLRLNANAKFNDEFSGGITIASGDPGDPISTNQTMSSFFQRKPILIDKAFVQYTPRWFKPLNVTAGKWGYTWYRTEMTWDNDLNPEGISEALTYNFKNSPLQRFAVVAFQSPFNEVSGGRDSGLLGGQTQTLWKLNDRINLGAYAGFYHFRNANPIAAAQGSVTGSSGALTGNNDTNATGLIGSTRAFASKFDILDTLLRLDVKTGVSRFPLMVLFDFAQNTGACGNLAAFGATPPACNPRDRQAYWAEIQLGKTQEQGDMRFGYTLTRIEREAVLSAFNFSDLRQGTNVANHRLEYSYQAYRNITLGFTTFIGRQLVTSTSATPERFLKRLQFDLIYKF